MEEKEKNINRPKFALLSLSGGLDSTMSLLYLLADKTKHYQEIFTYSFSYGQKHTREIKLAKNNVKYLNSLIEKGKLGTSVTRIHHSIIDLTSVFEGTGSSLVQDSNLVIPEGKYAESNQRSTVVPIRNIIFSSILFSKASGIVTRLTNEYTLPYVDIILGIHADDGSDGYPDTRKESVYKAQELYKISDYNSFYIDYISPFVNNTKGELLQQGIQSGLKIGLNKHQINKILKNTITCYNPDPKTGASCGKCASCNSRKEAFEYVKMEDPIEYATYVIGEGKNHYLLDEKTGKKEPVSNGYLNWLVDRNKKY